MGTREGFIGQQAALLGPLDYVVVTVMREPPGAIELSHEQDGGFRVRTASPKQPFDAEQAKALAATGFTETEGTWASGAIGDAASASALVERVLSEVFKVDETAAIDVDHGSRRPIVEAQQKLEAIRARVAPILEAMTGAPAPVDADGDYALKYFLVDKAKERNGVDLRMKHSRGRPTAVQQQHQVQPKDGKL